MTKFEMEVAYALLIVNMFLLAYLIMLSIKHRREDLREKQWRRNRVG